MNLFLRLTELPEDEDDLSTIIDKAGDFLIDTDDIENALVLYTNAEKAYPNNSLYSIGSGYCLGKLGDYENSIDKHRRAVGLEPNNYKHLNDLGFALLEAGEYEEAEQVLKKSISLAPGDYEFPRNNLEDLQNRKKKISIAHQPRENCSEELFLRSVIPHTQVKISSISKTCDMSDISKY